MDAATVATDAPPPCALGALAEPLAGSAPVRPVWALIEHAGPWGRDAVLDAPWPDVPETGDGTSFGARLAEATDAAGVRVVLARRHRTRPMGGPPLRPVVILTRVGPGGWAATRRLLEPAELLDLDWAQLTAGDLPPGGWDDAGAVWGVCTHGTRDACCARLGRPLVEALAAADPEHTWEVSHSGGHRFAGVLTTFPEGAAYGRVTPDDVPRLLAARRRGEVVLDLLRGRCDLPAHAQAAEIAVRAHLGHARLAGLVAEPLAEDCARDVVVTRWRRTPDDDGAETIWEVEARLAALPAHPVSCGGPAEPAASWLAGPVQGVSSPSGTGA